MSRVKKLTIRAIGLIRRRLAKRPKLRKRVSALTDHVLKPETVEKMKCWSRALRVQTLVEEIERELKNTKDPDERINLYSALATLNQLSVKGGGIPDNLEELLALNAEFLSMMCGSFTRCSPPLPMSDQMLQYAARGEKPGMKN